jgi:uncharacterized protein YprB with RNaseH-like and TPR domain
LPNDNPRILFLDIETKPALIYSFGIRDQHITHNQIKEDGGTICVGLKLLGHRKVEVFSDWEHGHQAMIEAVHTAVCDADAIGSFNGIRFDMPKLMGEFLLAGLPPPPQLTQIDAFQSVRKLGLISSKLAYVAPKLGLGCKLKHEGLEMWIKVMAGCPKAQRKMARYCAQDVRLLEDLYLKIRPYILNHPHLGRGPCGTCGSAHAQLRGVHRTASFHTERLQCQGCGKWRLGRRTKAA